MVPHRHLCSEGDSTDWFPWVRPFRPCCFYGYNDLLRMAYNSIWFPQLLFLELGTSVRLEVITLGLPESTPLRHWLQREEWSRDTREKDEDHRPVLQRAADALFTIFLKMTFMDLYIWVFLLCFGNFLWWLLSFYYFLFLIGFWPLKSDFWIMWAIVSNI